jgi:hypothetical protein
MSCRFGAFSESIPFTALENCWERTARIVRRDSREVNG